MTTRDSGEWEPGLGTSILGVWIQYLEAIPSRWLNGGLYRVDLEGGTLAMALDSTAEATDGVILPSALSRVRFNGGVWRFISEWRFGTTGEFVLRRVDDDLFHGHVYVDGQRSSPNLWKRVDTVATRVPAAFVLPRLQSSAQRERPPLPG